METRMHRPRIRWAAGALLLLFLAGCKGGGEAQFHNDQGIEQLGRDQYEEARMSFEKALELTPEDGVIWGNLGVALTRLERFDEALAAYRKSNDLAPGEPITVAEIAAIEYRLGHYPEAEAGFKEAIELEPRAPEFYSSLALALLRQGKAEAAREALDKALPEAGKRGVVRYQQAAFQVIEGRLDEAVKTFEACLANYPAGARSAISDPDFAPLYDNPRFQELVSDWWRPKRQG
jgi:Flp pilus assembly protein TadD